MENQVALITGAANGIGLALSKACLKDGIQVVMTDMNQHALQEQTSQLIQIYGSQVNSKICDVTDEQAVNVLCEDIQQEFKRIDLLINNAGVSGILSPIWALPIEEIKRVMDVNLYGVIHCIQAFLPMMLAQNHRSHIVNMASIYGLCNSSSMAPYAMSKHAILALSESLYFDLQRIQAPVDVSVVCPSFANTSLLMHSVKNDEKEIQQNIAQLMGHARCVDDLAESIMHEIHNKTFYILPDKEIKSDCQERTQAIIEQRPPFVSMLEKIMTRILRARK